MPARNPTATFRPMGFDHCSSAEGLLSTTGTAWTILAQCRVGGPAGRENDKSRVWGREMGDIFAVAQGLAVGQACARAPLGAGQECAAELFWRSRSRS